MRRAAVIRSKYGVRTDAAGKFKRTCDGILFDSQAECRRYGQLKLLEKAGEIRRLVIQPGFNLSVPSGGLLPFRIGQYVADFSYQERCGEGWLTVIEDVKGHATPLYRWKKRHVEAQYGVQIREIRL